MTQDDFKDLEWLRMIQKNLEELKMTRNSLESHVSD